jgi:hypothetical protein
MNNRTTLILSSLCLCLAACGDTDEADDTGTTMSMDSTDGGDTADGTDSTDGTDGTDGTDTTGDGDGDAQIRVIHLGVNVPAVDVFANSAEPAVATDLDFKQSSGYLTVPAGDYTFQVSLAGMTPADAVLEPSVTLDADTKYSAVALGDLNATDTALAPMVLPLVDDDADIDAANFRLQVVHAAPAVGEVDIWEISDASAPALLLENVPFAGNAYLDDIPAGALELGFDLDDDASPDVTFSVPDVSAGGLQLNVFAVNDDTGAVSLQIVTPGQMGAEVLEVPTN